jgi:glutamate 5-kinase
MATKLEAARIATAAGTEVRIVDGRLPQILLRVLRGEPLGTRFLARTDRVEGRKRWILSGLSHPGRLVIDDGAVHALLARGASLLPAGIVQVQGEFDQGDTVEIVAPDGQTIAAGITNYPASDVRTLKGRRSSEIESLLNYSYGDSVVHRDNLAALVRPQGNAHAV